MKINENAFAIACASAFGIVWVVCSLIVIAMPDMMSNMSSNMVHADGAGMGLHMSFWGVLIGGLLWIVFAGVVGWLIAKIYNAQLNS